MLLTLQLLYCRSKKLGGSKHQAGLAVAGLLDSDEGEEPQGDPEELEEEACLPGRAEAVVEVLKSFAPTRPAFRSAPRLEFMYERSAPLSITLEYDIALPVFAMGAVPTQPAADATKLPSPIRKGADRAPRFDCDSFDIAALGSDATDMAATQGDELRSS